MLSLEDKARLEKLALGGPRTADGSAEVHALLARAILDLTERLGLAILSARTAAKEMPTFRAPPRDVPAPEPAEEEASSLRRSRAK